METSSQHPPVTIVLINYNGWRFTDACLTSLRDLKYPAFRVLVVENGSTDDSLAQLRERWPDLELIEIARNVGFTAANNVGARRALEHGAQHVWFLNNDTVVDPLALSELVNTLEAEPRTGAVASVLYDMRVPEQVQAWGGGFVRLWRGDADMYFGPVARERLHFLGGTSLLVRRAALEQVGLFDERFFMYWEDADFGFRLRAAGWGLAVADGSRVWHVGSASMGEGNTRTTKSETFELNFTRSAVRFFRKHAPLPAVPILAGPGFHLLKRVLRGQWGRARAVTRGALQGFRRSGAGA
ncbi:rhamnosyltransferase (plasmid) [Deinococcus aetherius]|uniref:Rhamnosyltransferase n=1 Tax=Deinococcus aetherius TaxID=200252 RepID=A0ABN6RJ65_9DEIO|nr:glycosyltransferase family 2 protein [Deinococcus aetherius]BDP43392.1 rhamnosyltransferase [Deinococcus aetherius]